MTTQSFPFNPLKAFQAIAVLLGRERCKEMAYYRLLKLLYIAERTHLKRTGRPILGGHVVAMERGPLSSPVYDLIKLSHPRSPEWSRYFRVEGRHVEMLQHAGNGELSKSEIRTLLDVFETFEDRDDEELGAITHEYPEYQRNYHKGTSTPIPLTDIIEAVGLANARDAILHDAEEVSALTVVFGG